MTNDESAFVDFRCKRCDAVLCRTNGTVIRLFVGGYLATVWIAQMEMQCSDCGAERTWYSEKQHGDKAGQRSH